VFDAVDGELAVVFVGQVQRLGETAADPIDICADGWEALSERGLSSEGAILSCLKALVVGFAFWVSEDLGLEEGIVGVGCLVEEPGPLRMEFEGILEELQGIVDLAKDVRSHDKKVRAQAQRTWRSLVVSTSSSMFSSGSTLMAEKAACSANQLAAAGKEGERSSVTILS
jgi:hypothetical protein